MNNKSTGGKKGGAYSGGTSNKMGADFGRGTATIKGGPAQDIQQGEPPDMSQLNINTGRKIEDKVS